MQRIYVVEEGREEDEKVLEGFYEAARVPEVGESLQFDLGDKSVKGSVTHVTLKVRTAPSDEDVAEVRVRRDRFGAMAI